MGVDETASAEQIKSAFRKLAVQYHPDRNAGAEAEALFKEANEAYETLSNAQKRQAYDNQRAFAQNPGANFGPGGFSFHTNFDGNINDLFANIFGGGGFGPFARPVRNQDTHVQLEITLEDVLLGRTIPVQFTDSSGKNVNITVNIPPGIDHGTRLRYAGNGSRINSSLPPGDLIITVLVQPHSQFERNGPHLIFNLTISLWQALLGCDQHINTIDGSHIKIHVPRLSQDQTILKVAGRGLPIRNSRNRGDLLVRVCVVWPSQLSDSQVTAISNWTAKQS